MPDLDRVGRSWALGPLCRIVAGSTALTPLLAAPAVAQALRFAPDGAMEFDSVQVAWLSALVGAVCFAVVSAAALIRARGRAEEDRSKLMGEAADLKLAADRAEAVLNADDQRVVIWSGPGEGPLVMGSLPNGSGVPRAKTAFLAFGQWLEAASSIQLETRIRDLREKGEPFSDILHTTAAPMSRRRDGSRARAASSASAI